MGTLDYSLLKLIQDSRIEIVDPILQLFAKQTTTVTIAVILILIVQGIVRKDKFKWKNGLHLGVIILINAILVFVFKNLFQRPRPFITHSDIEKLTSGGSPSFPSGHTAEVFALAFALLFLFGRNKGFYIAIMWATIIAYCRMALGVHYPFDVLCGAVLGYLSALVVSSFIEVYYSNSEKTNG